MALMNNGTVDGSAPLSPCGRGVGGEGTAPRVAPVAVATPHPPLPNPLPNGERGPCGRMPRDARTEPVARHDTGVGRPGASTWQR